MKLLTLMFVMGKSFAFDCPAQVDDIKRYITCQATPALAACTGVGTAVAGRFAVQSALKYQDRALANETRELQAGIAKELNLRYLENRQQDLNKAMIERGKEYVEVQDKRAERLGRFFGDTAADEIEPIDDNAKQRIREINSRLRTLKRQYSDLQDSRVIQLRPRTNSLSPKQELLAEITALQEEHDSLHKPLSLPELEEIDEEIRRVRADKSMHPKFVEARVQTLTAQRKEKLAQAHAEFQEKERRLSLLEKEREKLALQQIEVRNEKFKIIEGKPAPQIIKTGIGPGLPEEIKKLNNELAQELAQKITAFVKLGGTPSESNLNEIAEQVYKRVPQEMQGEWQLGTLQHRIAKSDLSAVINSEIKSVVQKQRAILGDKFVTTLATLRKLGAARAGILAGGVIGAGFFVVDAATSATPTACDHRAHMNLDPNDFCRPIYEVNDDVARFLTLPPSQQCDVLKDQTTRNYYEELYKRFFKQPKFVSLQCQGKKGFTLITRDEAGQSLTHKVIYRDGGSIRQINLEKNGSLLPTLALDEEGLPISGTRTDENLARLRSIKLYIGDAAGCCGSKDDSEHAACVQAYNEKSAAPSRSAAPERAH